MTDYILHPHPIVYTAREVALMIQIRLFYAPDLPAITGADWFDVLAQANGQKQPSPEMLKHLELTPHQGGFVWQPS